MKASSAQLEANKRYKEKHPVKKVLIEFPESDIHLYEFLQTKEKKATYIKNLIRKDME